MGLPDIVHTVRSRVDTWMLEVLGVALIGVVAWVVLQILAERSLRRERRLSSRRSSRRRHEPYVTSTDLGTLVSRLPKTERSMIAGDLTRLLDAHGQRRFKSVVAVTREDVSPASFAFLYGAFHRRSQLSESVDVFRIPLSDAKRLLKACES